MPQALNEHIEALRDCLKDGKLHVRGDEDGLSEAEFLDYGRDRSRAAAPDFELLALPASTDEIAALMRYCYEHRLPVTPSGGRTGMSGGATAARGELVVSFARMNRLLRFDPYLPALHVEAGMITKVAQDLARERGYEFPLDLAASGSSQVGGNVATNAGGTRVIRLGGLRNYVNGLTAVTGTGEILRFAGNVLKNNTGLDLKQLFIGSEGTLGLITEVVVRLAPAPAREATVLFAVENVQRALDLLTRLRQAGMRPVAFEYFEAASTAIVCEHLSIGPPFRENYPAYALLAWDESDTAMETAVEIFGDLQFGPEAGVLDVRLAQNSNEAARLWQYREAISESITGTYAVHKQDISVPAAGTADFLTAVSELLTRDFPGVRGVFFGHLGDSNLHLNFIPTENGPSEARFREMGPRIDASVFPLIVAAGGSISAEHGIGLLKKKYLHYSRSPAEIQLMRQIKAVFDPRQILNPGKVLPDPEYGD